MQKMKKSNAMLSFLLWTVVALVFFFSFSACSKPGSKFFGLSDKSIGSYTNLIGIIEPGNKNSVKEGELTSTSFTMNKKSVVVGFSKDDNRFENHYLEGSKDEIKFEFLKPVNVEKGCEVGKACVCLCKGFELDKDTNPKSAEPCDPLICNSVEGIDLLSEKVVRRHDNGQPKYSWKGGFLIHMDISDSEDVNGMEKNNIATRTFYIQRHKNVVGVCLQSPCITDDAKAQIDASQT